MTTGLAIIEVSKNENHLKLQSRNYLVLHMLQFLFVFSSSICNQMFLQENRPCVSCRRRTKYPTIILFFAGCFDRGQIFWGVTALFPQRACLFVMVYSRGHARDQGVCGAGSHKHLYFHSQHGFQNHLHRYQVSFIDEIRGYS